MMGKGHVYLLREQVRGKFLKKIGELVCYRCGVDLIADEWVYAKPSRGDITKSERFGKNYPVSKPKIYHLDCAKEVHLA